MDIIKAIRNTRNNFRKIINNIINIEPCYSIVDNLDSKSVIIDIGIGNNADFSIALINKYGLYSFGFDPTKKHWENLKAVEKNNKNFKIFPFALLSNQAKVSFFESKENISGSFFLDHINIENDIVDEYKVEALTLGDIYKLIGNDRADLIKIDIEGSEYNLIKNLNKNDIVNIKQIIIEFHHHCIKRYTFQDTKDCVGKIKSFGYKVYTEDRKNYLFFRK